MMNPQEKKRLLERRAKRMLEESGFGMKKTQTGSYSVIDGKSEKILAQFDDIEQLGETLGLWGGELPESAYKYAEFVARHTGKWPKPPDKDPETGMDTPTTAAVREQGGH